MDYLSERKMVGIIYDYASLLAVSRQKIVEEFNLVAGDKEFDFLSFEDSVVRSLCKRATEAGVLNEFVEAVQKQAKIDWPIKYATSRAKA